MRKVRLLHFVIAIIILRELLGDKKGVIPSITKTKANAVKNIAIIIAPYT